MRRSIPDQSFLTRTIGNLGEVMFVSVDSTAVSRDLEDKLEGEIPLVNVTGRSEISRNIQ